MMNTMYSTGSFGFFPYEVLHIISVVIFAIGVALLLFWTSKHFSQEKLWRWGWILAVIGTVLCLLSIPGRFGSYGMMGSGSIGSDSYGMMGQSQNTTQSTTESAAQQKEEADGKALYDQLQAKQIACADLSDDNFELIGEYVMGQRAGASHEQMNVMIKQMMGGDDAPMHIFLAKNATGCSAGAQTGSPLVNGGGMMRQQ